MLWALPRIAHSVANASVLTLKKLKFPQLRSSLETPEEDAKWQVGVNLRVMVYNSDPRTRDDETVLGTDFARA